MMGFKLFWFLLLLGLILLVTPVGATNECLFETILNKTISTTTIAKAVNLAGYKDFAVMGRFDGPAGSKLRLEMEFNQLNTVQEEIELDASGVARLSKIYPVYAPHLCVTILNPPPKLKAKLLIYATH